MLKANKLETLSNFLQFNNIINSVRSYLDTLDIKHEFFNSFQTIQPLNFIFLINIRKDIGIFKIFFACQMYQYQGPEENGTDYLISMIQIGSIFTN